MLFIFVGQSAVGEMTFGQKQRNLLLQRLRCKEKKKMLLLFLFFEKLPQKLTLFKIKVGGYWSSNKSSNCFSSSSSLWSSSLSSSLSFSSSSSSTSHSFEKTPFFHLGSCRGEKSELMKCGHSPQELALSFVTRTHTLCLARTCWHTLSYPCVHTHTHSSNYC